MGRSSWGFPCSEGALHLKHMDAPPALSCTCSLVGKTLMGLVAKRKIFGLVLKYHVPFNSRSKFK